MTITEDPATGSDLKDGRVVGIAGPVVDVEFPRGSLPKLNTALEFTVQVDGDSIVVLAEVAQQLGDSRVRAICMKPTDGLTRGTAVRNLGHGLQVPVGDRTLGHVWNVWGDVLDDDPAKFADMERWDIHRDAPLFDALEPSRQLFPTGIKVIDLLTPVPRRREDRPVRWRRRGQDRADHRDDQPRRVQARRRVGVRRCRRAHS